MADEASRPAMGGVPAAVTAAAFGLYLPEGRGERGRGYLFLTRYCSAL